jgi:predicted patatin/cPLA2 family phospholipase
MKSFALSFAVIALVAGAFASIPSHAQTGPRLDEATQNDPGRDRSIRRKGRKPKPQKQAKDASDKPDKKSKPAERTPYTAEEAASAIVPALPGVRFFADSFGAFADALPRDKGPWLILSSGGSTGAYGAGVLCGLSEAGKRPDYSVVTGVSIGAIMAPYAFLGQKYDKELHDSFLNLTSADVFEDANRPDSLVDTWPLKDQLTKRVTPQLLADIAAEHRKGRRLFIMTANLDSERPVAWNMGAIAAHGGEAAMNLFRQVLLAASAIPGVFPPVYIDVESGGRKFQEMHVDGGVFSPFFVAPSSWLIDPAETLPVSELFVIIHSKLVPEFDVTGAEKIFIIGHTISAAIKVGAQAELALLSAAVKRDGIGLNVAYVDSSFSQPAQTAFDPKQMKALFDLGFEQAKNGTAFRTQNNAVRGQAQ